ncbi:TPA: hypothetical protein QDA84_004385 [Burkholderia vietnamiensis]|nr:hypothetical protein [Burkholderia vietnamiensis]
MSEHDALPAWAPASLVEKYQRVRIDESGGDSNDWPTGLPHAQVEAVLRRLLTREDMRAAWATLERAPMNPRLQRRHFEGPTIPDRYWIEIAFALRDFASLPKFTSKEKREPLRKIAAQARALIQAIEDNPYAIEVQRQVPRNRASSQHMKLRTEDFDDWPSSRWTSDFLTEDAGEARTLSRAAMSAPRWEALPINERFSFWTRALYSSELTDLLNHFAGWIEQEANIPPEVKQPGRGDQGLIAFMMRRLSSLAISLHGTPLDETVGIIVTAALDLPRPLGGDEVRRDRKRTGAKLTIVK